MVGSGTGSLYINAVTDASINRTMQSGDSPHCANIAMVTKTSPVPVCTLLYIGGALYYALCTG